MYTFNLYIAYFITQFKQQLFSLFKNILLSDT